LQQLKTFPNVPNFIIIIVGKFMHFALPLSKPQKEKKDRAREKQSEVVKEEASRLR
jgi:hypothetical protein